MKKEIKSYLETHRERFLKELFELLRIPSISADPSFKTSVAQCAEMVKKRLEEAGADRCEIIPTQGHPVVYAEKIISPALPTVLIYGHYDVQPVDPIELWETPPFEPTIKKTDIHPEGAIFARGAADDKGQFYMHVKAFEILHRLNALPCNIKFIIEGEEEVGSAHLEEFIKQYQNQLACNCILISDTAMLGKDKPSITVGLRGLTYMEVEITGPCRDLHSGIYGGAIDNPANVLCEIIAKLKDETGRITIPGFYDEVATLSEEERALYASAGFNENEFKKSIGVTHLRGEKGYTPMEWISIRPTLDINGIWSGYTGEGAKTVLPAKAHAKISMRLVPYQQSQKIGELFKQYVEQLAPPTVKTKVSFHHGGEPVVVSMHSPAYKAAEQAMTDVFGLKPFPVRGGGSIPIVALFQQYLTKDIVLMGFGLDSDALHSPNENYGLSNFYKGIETIAYFYQYYHK